MTEQRQRSEAIPEEYSGLIGEFRGLLEKYPDAAGHFSLAYHPEGHAGDVGLTTTAAITQPVFECSEIEPGFVVCRRVHEQ
ncbi:hypothetical protein ACIGBL_23025 [Streptomyces sp. NPDC085614]|uniref:hypothetical protein n=1 Tax=Streptomyces sp. NPDC085614 TaxID=3365733 RepID=UPI0037D265BE